MTYLIFESIIEAIKSSAFVMNVSAAKDLII